MNTTFKLTCCVALGSMVGASAWAQSSVLQQLAPDTRLRPTVTLATAIDAAWQRAVASREAQGQQQRAEADRVAASSLWASPPILELNHRNDRWQTDAGRRENEIGIAWPLLLPGQREARGAFADSGLSLADQSQRAARLHIAGEVRERAWALIAQQAVVAQAETSVRSLTALTDDVERRVKAGDLARADALAARAELLSATAQLTEARHNELTTRSRWTLLTGLDRPSLAEEPPVAAQYPLTEHPEYRLAVSTTEHARRRAALVKSSHSSPPEVFVGARQDIPGRNEPSQNSLNFGIRLPFGTADRNRPLQAAALSELDIAETAEQRMRDRLEADVMMARAALHSNEEQLQAERMRASLLRERATLVDKSFRAGESALPELLRSMSAAAQADSALSRQQASLGLARARFHQSLGLLP